MIPTQHRPRGRTACGAGRWLAVLCLLFGAGVMPGAAWGQFNGSFAIERHVLEAENFLDWRAYQPPPGWRQEALRSPNVFRGTVGSLSQKRFYLSQEIRLEKRFGRYGSVHYFQQEESFFRSEPIYQEFELRLGRRWSASLVGFPRHEKVLGSAGLAVAWGDRTENHFLRLTRLEQFGLFNEEHTGEERFAPTPVLHRLEGRVSLADRFLAQVTLRDERPTVFETPSSDQPALAMRQRYAGRKAEVLLDARWVDGFSTVLAYRRERERRVQAPLGGASTVPEHHQTLRYDWWDASAVMDLAGGSVVEAGAYRGGFRNDITDAVGAVQFSHHLLTDAAYVFWHWPVSDWRRWQFSLQVGRAELATMDTAAPGDNEATHTTEMKAGVGVVLQEAGNYRVFFNTTWDLDIFRQRQWDGGNIQVQWLF